MKTLIALLLTTTCAFAQMPPKDLDLGNETMSERQILATYRGAFPDAYAAMKLIRVPFGKAREACLALDSEPWASLPTYGCNVRGNIVVYSYDTRLLAFTQGRGYSPNMANHVLRHEFAHYFFDWPADHPRACATLCEEETQ